MPKVPILAVPIVAIICSADDVVPMYRSIDVNVPVNVNVPVHVDISVDVNVPVDVDVAMNRGSES